MSGLSKAEQDALLVSLTDEVKSAVETARKTINWPTRRACADCGTRKGKLRRACPYCAAPVCDECYYPTVHKHRVAS